MSHRFRRVALAAVPGLALATVFTVAATHHQSPTATPPQVQESAAISISGSKVDKVQVDGKVITFAEYAAARVPQSETAGKPLHLIVDHSAIARGYLVAFTDESQAQRYMTAHGMGSSASGEKTRQHNPALDEHPQTKHLNGLPVDNVTCSLPNHYAKLYDVTACTGSSFIVLWGENDPDLSVYGFNDKTSSIAIGNCISNLDVWKDKNYTGAHTSYGGGDVYTIMGIVGSQNFNNIVSSVKADNNHMC